MTQKIDITQVDIRRAALPDGAIPPFGTNPILMKCPHHKDDAESLAIYPDHAHCYGCSFRISRRMEALAWLLGLPDWKAALSVASQYTFLEKTKRQNKPKTRRAPTMAEVSIYESLLEDRIEWFHQRGLSTEMIHQARLGHNGAAFVIPVFDGRGKLVTLRYRNDEEISGKEEVEYDENLDLVKTRRIPKYRGWTGANDACLYPAWKFEADRSDYVVLVEGEFDALLLWQRGIPAITATNGAGQQGLVLDLVQEYYDRIKAHPRRRPALRRVVICGDRDEPGTAACRKLFLRAKEEYDEVVWIQWPRELGKDVTEVLGKGYSFDYLLEHYGKTEEDRPSEDRDRRTEHHPSTSERTGGGGYRNHRQPVLAAP